ncbi:hypothetical protein TcasGA2_TC004147 [Tribolium castaneum]|uniref:Uncharacterized protein n=1 Tax=Tribolium castaneum TaxID=7070 RepID=D6W6P5_TRICA|nr:hypothetical protein TcasGA2_TC004147 [Tribolium castaneum]
MREDCPQIVIYGLSIQEQYIYCRCAAIR